MYMYRYSGNTTHDKNARDLERVAVLKEPSERVGHQHVGDRHGDRVDIEQLLGVLLLLLRLVADRTHEHRGGRHARLYIVQVQ